jgi:hypothetical protein
MICVTAGRQFAALPKFFDCCHSTNQQPTINNQQSTISYTEAAISSSSFCQSSWSSRMG